MEGRRGGRSIGRLFGLLLRWRSRLGLGWKLTLSYTLVTVAALLVAELLLFLFAFLAFLGQPSMAQISAETLVTMTAPRLQRPLVEEPPDGEAIRSVLRSDYYLAPGETLPPVSFEKGSLPEERTTLVLGPHGRMIAAFPDVRGFTRSGGGVDEGAVPGLSRVLEVARAGEEDPGRLYHRLPTGGYVAAAPVKDEEGRVVGLVVEAAPAFVASPFMVWLIPFVLIALGITAVVGVLGTAFGFLTARSLTRRLRTLTRASQSWSRGEFAVATGDPSGDEIGQLSRALDHMTTQLEDLMRSRQDLATLEARNRFARDLHDSVKQQVFAASLQVDTARALNGKRAEGHLERANELLRQAHKELDGLIHELRPAMLEGRGLATALREYAAGWSRGSEVPVDVRVRGEREAPLEVEQALFRVAQEALANVARHSDAGRAAIDLVYEDHAVVLRVSDDGRGFDPAGDHAGYGLRSMRERLSKLGGEVRVESAPGRGTSVACRCPLAEIPKLPADLDPKESPA